MIKALFALGTSEIVVIVLIVVLLFGAKKIPELMRGMGRGVKEFKDAVNGEGSENENDVKDNDAKKE
jgi:sec-independent protein translocase protein TatA